MNKPKKLNKQFSFNQSSEINSNFLEKIFCPTGIGSLPKINKKEIQKISEELLKVAMLLETDMLGQYMKRKSNEYDLIRLELHLSVLADKVHNLNQSYTPLESDIMKYHYPYQFNHFELYHMKREILSDIIQTIMTIYNVTKEDELSDEDKLYFIQYISQSMVWLIDKGYCEMFTKEMIEDEINEVLSMKALCRIYEDKIISKDFITGNFYRGFAKEKKNENNDIK
ncbi:hypothetical protein [Niallia taxi]|uniref:Uncharacterized protein n=1 Tax=Niallia taxi TaxID=2499688 RepID=A0A437KE01_9BACI|nr:hypothetical protein [Niallia taxi]RVT65295.1 hypothetical protein EM808_07245 [Niallia taxi]